MLQIKANYYKLYQKQPVDTQKYLQSWTVVAQNVIKNVKRKKNPEVEELLAYLDVSNQGILNYILKSCRKVFSSLIVCYISLSIY